MEDAEALLSDALRLEAAPHAAVLPSAAPDAPYRLRACGPDGALSANQPPGDKVPTPPSPSVPAVPGGFPDPNE